MYRNVRLVSQYISHARKVLIVFLLVVRNCCHDVCADHNQEGKDADHHSGSEAGSGSGSESGSEEEEGEEEDASQASGSDKGKGLFGLALPKFGTCYLLGGCYSSDVLCVASCPVFCTVQQ
jgi:hypothetical protein